MTAKLSKAVGVIPMLIFAFLMGATDFGTGNKEGVPGKEDSANALWTPAAVKWNAPHQDVHFDGQLLPSTWCEGLAPANQSPRFAKSDGFTHYCIEWDGMKDSLVVREDSNRNGWKSRYFSPDASIHGNSLVGQNRRL